MKLELLSISRDAIQPRYSVVLLATYSNPDGTQSDHFSHFTVRFTEEEISEMNFKQIEANAIEKAKALQS